MTLIKSISGIRGTIGGKSGEALTPLDIVRFTSAYGTLLKKKANKGSVIIGRDARVSGEMVRSLVCGSLMGLGLDIIDLGLSTTPTVEMAVPHHKALGGIILTASHNPGQWNALKLLNHKGEFISAAEGEEVLAIAAMDDYHYAEVQNLGSYSENQSALDFHIQAILQLASVDKQAILNRNFKIVVDPVNSSGSIAIPALLKSLGVTQIEVINAEPNGLFAHNPEPLAEHLTEICEKVKASGADLGIVVDPDVDRLAFITEKGEMFGEEYTLVAVADYLLQLQKGNTVSNLSSSRALRDITEKHGGSYFASAVGEVNVVEMMKANNAIIGGEGNGGIILPELHYGRDALVGTALFLSHIAKSNKTLSELKAGFPQYFMSKNKIELKPGMNPDTIIAEVKTKFANEKINEADGLKIDFEATKEWVHLRKSNTEPIIRIYSESQSTEQADQLARKMIDVITELIS